MIEHIATAENLIVAGLLMLAAILLIFALGGTR